ncbi:hypothetical protein A2344_00475 [Candidatus Peregrinibacteria bacterium RIFOXYB12_FULL_41_12]|nr:MAG: hypothetical protein A2244_01230 [Candidatus Peregrinibacteria bacterium RIFOXYA2_FULL_41_18]OGJ48997.1 MAG: hypothetical protein A2344_00475 [Candidatus Peregrinibacteria bacterium RIFOXYB12_FULL_41_12]
MEHTIIVMMDVITTRIITIAMGITTTMKIITPTGMGIIGIATATGRDVMTMEHIITAQMMDATTTRMDTHGVKIVMT